LNLASKRQGAMRPIRSADMRKLVLALPLLFLAHCGPDELVTLNQPIQTCQTRQELTEVLAGEGCTSIDKGTKLLIVSEKVIDELTYECVRPEHEQDCRWALGPVRRLGKS
jgi:hypothetical protein